MWCDSTHKLALAEICPPGWTPYLHPQKRESHTCLNTRCNATFAEIHVLL